ncbi:MAG: phosphoribosyl-AMP cyclohydrolase [Geodermatophilaceae bacterium]|nr:phosphoribosyl-AMP cyclohydrolase [Geodermatophilaceae bacterium]
MRCCPWWHCRWLLAGPSPNISPPSRRSGGLRPERTGAGIDNGVVTQTLDPEIAARLRTDDQGLLPVVVQSIDTGAVLMLAWMDAEALSRTLSSGQATYWSRSRQQYWVKGESSGHRQQVHQVMLDCDGDSILLRVKQTGPACHTGSPTCFFTPLPLDPAPDAA